MYLPRTVAFVSSPARQINVNGKETCFHPSNESGRFVIPEDLNLDYANWVSEEDYNNFDIVEFCRVHYYRLVHKGESHSVYEDKKGLRIGLFANK